ncbi:iron reductase [Mycobacteroides abscessus]|uniref:iron reductase n=1 Tax=Mycobacteroides abscessus TaxID=36809 RepID=UPI0039F04D71
MTLAIDRSSSTRSLIADDPLIAGMSIRQSLPLHESSTRLRELYPECPRAYGVAVMSDVGRRRWWPLARALNTDRLEQMYARAVEETGSDSVSVHQLADALVHTVVGRLVALVVLEGRAWDPGLGNLWVYFDSEGCIDWAGVVDPTLRVLPDDPDRDRQQVVVFPGEDALAAWTAHRCHRALTPLFTRLSNVSSGAMEIGQMWQLVGSTVVGAATHVPLLARSSETDGMRRGQAILDRFMTLGLPVRHKALAI